MCRVIQGRFSVQIQEKRGEQRVNFNDSIMTYKTLDFINFAPRKTVWLF